MLRCLLLGLCLAAVSCGALWRDEREALFPLLFDQEVAKLAKLQPNFGFQKRAKAKWRTFGLRPRLRSSKTSRAQ